MTEMKIGVVALDYLRQRSHEVGDCWLWRLAVGKTGYPIMSPRQTGESLVRRVAARLAGLPLQQGCLVVTSCGEKCCVNPAHMRLSDHKRVAAAAREAGAYRRLPRRAKIAAAKRASSKLTMEDARAIRASGERLRDIAAAYGVSLGTIKSIRSGSTWREYGSPWAGLWV